MRSRFSRREFLLLATAVGGFGAAVVVLERLRSLLSMPSPTPLSLTPQPVPQIVSRSEWGALPPNHDAVNEYGHAETPLESAWYVYNRPLDEIYNTVVIHHSATLLGANETMPSLQRLHLEINQWADVAYHYAIDKNGVIYEGRDIHVRGASVAGHNTGIIGVVVMGDFERDQPLDLQITVLQSLVNWLAGIYSLSHLAAHAEFNPESICPGEHFVPYLDQLAQNAGLARGTEGYVAPL